MPPCASHLLTPVSSMLPTDRTSTLAQSIYMRDSRWFVGRIGSGDGKMDPTRMEPAVCWGRRRGGWWSRSRERAGARCAGQQGFRRHIEREQRMVRACVAVDCIAFVTVRSCVGLVTLFADDWASLRASACSSSLCASTCDSPLSDSPLSPPCSSPRLVAASVQQM